MPRVIVNSICIQFRNRSVWTSHPMTERFSSFQCIATAMPLPIPWPLMFGSKFSSPTAARCWQNLTRHPHTKTLEPHLLLLLLLCSALVFLSISSLPQVELHAYSTPEELKQDLQGADVILAPSRSEPAGHMGLKALCTGELPLLYIIRNYPFTHTLHDTLRHVYTNWKRLRFSVYFTVESICIHH